MDCRRRNDRALISRRIGKPIRAGDGFALHVHSGVIAEHFSHHWQNRVVHLNSDREIRALQSTGALQVGKGKASILKADRFLFYWGLFLMLPVLCYWGLFAFAFYHPARGLPPFVAVAMICAIAYLLAGFTHYSTFRPINILRHCGFKLGDKFVLRSTAERDIVFKIF